MTPTDKPLADHPLTATHVVAHEPAKVSDKPMTVDALEAIAREVGQVERRHCIGKAQGFDVRDAYSELRAAIEQYGREQREAAATSKQVEDCVPAPPFDPAVEPPWHRSDMGPAGRGSGEPVGQVFGIIDHDYARVFTHARIVAWQYGYACLAHGSFTRDLDLLLVPWTGTAKADDVDYFALRIANAAGLKVQNPPSVRPHGRKTWTLLFPGFADPRWVDLSVLSPTAPQPRAPLTDEQMARLFHDTYERLAPSFGYETRPETKAFDPESPNGRLMIAVIHNIRSEG